MAALHRIICSFCLQVQKFCKQISTCYAVCKGEGGIHLPVKGGGRENRQIVCLLILRRNEYFIFKSRLPGLLYYSSSARSVLRNSVGESMRVLQYFLVSFLVKFRRSLRLSLYFLRIFFFSCFFFFLRMFDSWSGRSEIGIVFRSKCKISVVNFFYEVATMCLVFVLLRICLEFMFISRNCQIISL